MDILIDATLIIFIFFITILIFAASLCIISDSEIGQYLLKKLKGKWGD